ncbi:MAG: DNA ligase D [Bdellovibrio sp.]|nr:DNA ligase D [Bdellovibrio sp.]
MSLKEYHLKRDFKRTKEPDGRKPGKEGHIFVIQKHDASHLHYDFRLELDGVLKSWAVPKGPPKTTKEKRLAVEVEDHPVSYATFEGTIPKGEYGAGTVEIWDHGTWEPIGNPQQQLKKGHLDFELKGDRLSGRWLLVRTHLKAKKANWLLMKRSGSMPKKTVSKPTKKSDEKTEMKVVAKSISKLPSKKLPAFIEPELCALVDQAPKGDQWIHEIKFDGYRSLCRKENTRVQMLTRSGLDWSAKYKATVDEMKRIKAKSFFIDGEIAWVDDKGRSQFDGLQDALTDGRSQDLVYYVFDLLYLNGKDLKDLPLLERKKLLSELIKNAKLKNIIFSDHQIADGNDVFKEACRLGFEGIISKNVDAAYNSGRSTDWVKTKCTRVQEFVIGGYSVQENSKSIGALLLGEYDDKGYLTYVGRVGTGFNSKNSLGLEKKMAKLLSKENPFFIKPSTAGSVRWLKPQLVANVEFGAWTSKHILRHAAFKGLREDKKAKTVKKEIAVRLKSDGIRVTHPDKVIFKEGRVTKLDLVNYYKSIQKWILPHIINRPLSLLRCPFGQGKPCFFQKHLDREAEDVSIRDLDGLLHLIQINALELHAWGTHVDHMDNPDLIVFDLDPDPTVSWKEVKTAALQLKKILDQLNLKNFLKVSGNKGLHIHVPVAPVYAWDEIKNFAKSVCDQMVSNDPDRYTTQLLKKNRKNKIFLDYLRNGEGATAIVPFSVRATPQASVALPISWKELTKLAAPNSFTLKTVEKILSRRKDPWDGYFKVKQKIKVLDQAKKK